MTEIPIVVSTNEITVGGVVDQIELQLGLGEKGDRGSRIFSGDVSPLTLPANSPFFSGYTEFKPGDVYIERSVTVLALWEWKSQPGGYTWVQTATISTGEGSSGFLDADLEAIAALTGTNGLLRKTATNTWVLDTNSYLTSNQSITLSGDVTGTGTSSITTTVADDSHSHTSSTISALDAGDTTTGTFNIARIPTGTTGTTVALGNHTHSGYQAADNDLTAIAAISGTGYLRRTGVDTWTLDTPATATWGGITGTLSSQTDLQNALNAKQAADNDLTAIAALAGTSGFLKKTATDTWTLDTNTYLTANQSITLSGVVTGSGTTGITTSFAANPSFSGTVYASNISTTSISARLFYPTADGVPTSNLGTPTVQEMAFESQFANKIWFYDPSMFTFEYTMNGTDWLTQSPGTTEIKKLVAGAAGPRTSSVYIPNLAQKYRITIDNSGAYVYLNALYAYFSTNSHYTEVTIWKKRDDGEWIQHTTSTSKVCSWPGHLYLPFETIQWSTTTTIPEHYNDVRIEFTPTWTTGGSYDYENIYIMALELWGGYPAGKRTIYSFDQDRNVTFPADLHSETSSVNYLSNYSIAQASSAVSLGGFTAKYVSPEASDKPTGVVDGYMMTAAYSTAWANQWYGDPRRNTYYVRSLNNNSWQPWRSLASVQADATITDNAIVRFDSTLGFVQNSSATIDDSGTVTATTFSGALSGNASTATSAATWTTARTLTIGSTGKSVNGSGNVSWSLGEIGAQPAGSYQAADGDLTAIAALTGTGFLQRTGTDTWSLAAAGTGDVVGPSSATDNGIALFNTTTGKLIKDGLVTLTGSGTPIKVSYGSGNPTYDLNVSAPPGSIHFSSNATSGYSHGIWFKNSGTDTTGWEPVARVDNELVYGYGEIALFSSGQGGSQIEASYLRYTADTVGDLYHLYSSGEPLRLQAPYDTGEGWGDRGVLHTGPQWVYGTDVGNRISVYDLPPDDGGVVVFSVDDLGTAKAKLINIAHRTAPSSPQDGDVWTTTAGMYVRVNGTTVGPFGPWAAPTWIAPTLGNSWVNYGSGYTNAGYYKDNEGIVRLRGVIKDGTSSTAIFTLPVGFRPAAQHYFISVGGAGLSTVLVGSDGVVQVGAYIASGTNAYVSLDQISFSTW